MFYDTFHKLCLDKGVSDSRACTDMGLSRSYAAKMKNKDGTPSMDSLSAMSEYFGVSVDYLLHGDEPQKEKPTAQGGELTEKDVICVRYVEKAKEIAKKKGIAFTHISTELGKSRGYLSEMLANGRDLPEHMLADVASLLGVTVDDLRGDTENEKKPTAQGGELISDLPENIQKLISICLQNPDFTVLLLDLAQRMQNPPADPA